MAKRLPTMFGTPDRTRLNEIAAEIEADPSGELNDRAAQYLRGLANEKDRRLAAAEKRTDRAFQQLVEVEAERDSRLTKEQVREKLAAEIPTWFQSWIDHHKAEQELAENSDESVAAKQHEVAVDAFEDAIRYALAAADAAFKEEVTDA